MSSEEDIVRASELGEYSYCARAWWMARVLGYSSANERELRAGKARHRAHGNSVERLDLMRRLGLSALLLAALAVTAFLVLTLAH